MPRRVEEWIASLPATHPATAGPIAFRVESEDGLITAIEPRFDLVHRGTEKLFASRDYRQCLVLADRHDWHSAFNSELGLVMLLEDAMGIVVPEKAQWARTLLAELGRAIHGLTWIGGAAAAVAPRGTRDGKTTPGGERARAISRECRDAREALVSAQAGMSGGRMHPMVVRPGGLRAADLCDWPDSARVAVDLARSAANAAREWLDGELAGALVGKAVLNQPTAEAFAAGGPVARASGLSGDLRRDTPYAKYGELMEAGVLARVAPTRQRGDAWSRLAVVTAELPEALACVSMSAERVAGTREHPEARLPRAWRVPAGEYYVRTEGPTGVNGWLLVARGGPHPARLKIASASFANAQALCAAMIGEPVEHLPAMVISSLLVAGDLGR